MKKKLVLVLALLMMVSLFATACGQSTPAPAAPAPAPAEGSSEPAAAAEVDFPEMTLRMSVTTSDVGSWYKGGMKLAEIVGERTGGKVTIEVYPNEQLSGGNQGVGIEQVQQGVTDMSFHSTIIYSIMDPKFSVVSMPWIIPNINDMDRAMAGEPGEAIKEIVRSKGIEPLAFGENGYRQLTTNRRAVRTPADMSGMKIRIPGIQMYIDLFQALGADPTAMNFAEVFTALQQGTIDGQENPLPVITTNRLYEVQDYVTLWNYSYDPLVIGINMNKFNSFSPELQQIFREAAVEAAAYQIDLNRQEEAEAIAFLEEQGMEVIELTDAEVAAFRDLMAPVYEKYEPIIGEDLMNLFLNF